MRLSTYCMKFLHYPIPDKIKHFQFRSCLQSSDIMVIKFSHCHIPKVINNWYPQETEFFLKLGEKGPPHPLTHLQLPANCSLNGRVPIRCHLELLQRLNNRGFLIGYILSSMKRVHRHTKRITAYSCESIEDLKSIFKRVKEK